MSFSRQQYGAAYQTLFERVNPRTVSTREMQATMLATFRGVMEWAATQAPEIQAAYAKAVTDISNEVEAAIVQWEFSRSVTEARKDFPVPPLNVEGEARC